MLDSFKRWAAGASEGPAWGGVADWARERKGVFKRARDNEGFVVDGMLDERRAWRLEWGPPQRSYIDGRELRLRIELGLPPELQMLLMSRPLMETLERQTFERYTEQMQTQIDVSTPEEMRWLAMLPKVAIAAKEVRTRFGALAMVPRFGAAWLEGALAQRLADAALGVLSAEPPLVLMTLRGRVYLRTQLAEPDPASLSALTDLFETAAAQALRVAGGAAEGGEGWPSTASTAWQTQLQPEPPADA